MATNLDLDPDLVERALALSGAPTKKAAVTVPLRSQAWNAKHPAISKKAATRKYPIEVTGPHLPQGHRGGALRSAPADPASWEPPDCRQP